MSGPEASRRAWEDAYVRFETPGEEIRKFERRLRQLGAADWPRDAAIVEIFSGRGNGLVALERLGFTRVSGVDLSARLVAMYRGPARCVVGDCRAIPLQTASQDVAIAQGGLHHLPDLSRDLPQVLADVRRVLKPGGRFVAVEPWQTPFLGVVHAVSRNPIARRLWSKMDAFQTMVEHEADTYDRWRGAPDEILALLRRTFEPVVLQQAWGKLLFVGVSR